MKLIGVIGRFLRLIATPVNVILLGLIIWALVGPVIFLKSQIRRRRVRHTLEVNGVDLQNPGVMAIASRVNNLGVNSIEPLIESIDEVRRNLDFIATGGNKISTDEVNKLIIQRILIKDEKGQLVLNPNRMGLVRMMTVPGPNDEVTIIEGEEEMTNSGILVPDGDNLRLNEHAVQALTVLAKFYGKKIPEEFAPKASDTTKQDGQVSPK
jgi:hypothetical protein